MANNPGVTQDAQVVQCDGISSGTTQLSTVVVSNMPSYATVAVNKATGYFYTLVPNTGITPDGVTVVRSSDGSRDWFGGPGSITGLSGDVVATGPGVAASTIQSGVVSNGKLATMAAHTFKGNNTGSTASPLDLSATQLTAELNNFTSTLKGLAPLSGGGTTNFLRADATWAAPAGGINQLTGDGTAGPGTGSQTFTLATVGIGKGGTGQTSAGAASDALASSSFTIAAAATTDLSTVAGSFGTVTGSGSITTTALGTVAAGVRKYIKVGPGLFWRLNNAASLLIPGSSDAVWNAGDLVVVESMGSGNWMVVGTGTIAAVAIGNTPAGLSGIVSANVCALSFNSSFVLPQVPVAVGGGSAGSPQYTYQGNTHTGSYAVATDDIAFSSNSVQQWHYNGNGMLHDRRHQQKVGATVASATTITLGGDGNVFPVSGATAITGITTTNWQAGSIVILIPASASITLGHLTSAGGIRTKTASAVTPVANNAYMLVYDGTTWDLL